MNEKRVESKIEIMTEKEKCRLNDINDYILPTLKTKSGPLYCNPETWEDIKNWDKEIK